MWSHCGPTEQRMASYLCVAWPCMQARTCRPYPVVHECRVVKQCLGGPPACKQAKISPWTGQDLFAYASPCNKHTFGLKMRFIVKFSHKSLSEWFSCRTFAPQAARRHVTESRRQQYDAVSGNRGHHTCAMCACKSQTRQIVPINAVFGRSERVSRVLR